MLAVEGELRARRVVELRGRKAALRVAGRAVLGREEAPVDVLVAVGAARVLEPHERRRLHVARLAGDGRVPALERVAGLVVVELPPLGERLEARRDVARRARPERGHVGVPVAVLAGGEARDPVVALRLVAALAGRLQVGAGQRVLRLRVVEALPRVLEGDARRVAGLAGRAEGSVVDVLVAGGARGREAEERARLVAGLAVERGVQAVEGEAGLALVVEALRLEVPEVAVDARVLDVAARAVVPRRVAVDALARLDALGDGLVALEALDGRHPAARLVAASGSCRGPRASRGAAREARARRDCRGPAPRSRAPRRAQRSGRRGRRGEASTTRKRLRGQGFCSPGGPIPCTPFRKCRFDRGKRALFGRNVEENRQRQSEPTRAFS